MVDDYKTALDREGHSHKDFFLKDFEATLKNQKYYRLNCVFEIYDENRKSYYEETNTDEVFHLYRGTNRNESCHKRLNQIYPDRCSEALGDSFLDAFTLSYNLG